MAYDKTTFQSGLAMGLCGKGDPTFAGSDVFSKSYLAGAKLRAKRRIPTAYSYNGTVLPKLPEWDKSVYPYAVITLQGLFTKTWYLIAGQDPPYKYTANGEWAIRFSSETSLFWGVEQGSMGEAVLDKWDDTTYGWGAFMALSDVIWSSFDVLNEDGTVYLAASDPVPVYE